MNKVANFSAYVFILAVVLLSGISIFGVWSILERDVILKSFQSISILAIVTLVVLIAERFVDSRGGQTATVNYSAAGGQVAQVASPFTTIRHITLVLLVASVVLLALLGIMSIWEVVGGSVIVKSLSSIAIVGFASFVIVITCLDRENHKLLGKGRKPLSAGGIILIAFLVILLISLFNNFF